MADLSSLNVRVKSIDEASATIDKISASLKNLGSNLNGIKTNGLDRLSNSLRSLSSLGKIDNNSRAIRDMAKAIAEANNIKSTKGLSEITQAYEDMFAALSKAKSTGDYSAVDVTPLHDAVAQYTKLKNAVEETDAQVRDFVKNYKGIVNLSDVADEFGDNLKRAQQVLGDNFKLDSGTVDMDTFLHDLASSVSGAGINLDNYRDGALQLVEILEGAEERSYSLSDAIKAVNDNAATFDVNPQDVDNGIWESVANDLNTLDKQFDNLKDTSTEDFESSVANVSKALESLQGIQIPDLSSLDNLRNSINSVDTTKLDTIANGLTKLSDDSMSKAAQNIDVIAIALKKLENIKIPDVSELAQLKKDIDKVNKQSGKGTKKATKEAQESVKENTEGVKKQAKQAAKATAEATKKAADSAAENAEKIKEAYNTLLNNTKGIVEAANNLLSDNRDRTKDWYTNVSDAVNSINSQLKEYQNITKRMKGGKELFDAERYKEATKQIEDLKTKRDALIDASKNASKAPILERFGGEEIDYVNRLTAEIKSYQATIRNMDSGKIPFDADQYQAAFINIKKAKDEYKDITDTLKGEALGDALDDIGEKTEELGQTSENAFDRIGKAANDMVGNLLALGHEIEKLSQSFDKIGDYGIKALQVIYKPLEHVANEYKEKIEGIIGRFQNMRKAVSSQLKRMGQFWKRSMKTFTFMLVRKAITAMIDNMKNATESLARFSKTVGTSFNDSISAATSDFEWMGRAMLGAFEPIINTIVPILDALAAKIVSVMTLVGEFFAALTGQSYFVKAKKNVVDYADSLDSASKSQKNLTMGIDELNILSESESGGSGVTNPLDEWETEEVTSQMQELADKTKEIFEKLFDPLQKAWDRTKDYVTSGFTYMLDEIAELGAAIGKDFLKVWQQPETIEMLENMLLTVGDIERVIGNFAARFREAWVEGDKGLHILENLRDIAATLVQHFRNATAYMVEWSESIDFNPLLEAVESLSGKLVGVADFFGQVFEDVMQNIVLKYIEFLIEDGIPHLLNTIGEIIDAFDFEDLRNKLIPLEISFEGMLENIDIGITNAIGNIGKEVAEYTKSEEFAKFLETVAWFMGLVTADRVEKLFTALGLAIVDVAKSVAKFVSSDTFLGFLDRLVAWYDSLSVEQLASAIQNIALAIAAFKFAAFIGKGLEGFISFLTAVRSAQNISHIAKSLTEIGANSGVATTGLAKVGETIKNFDVSKITNLPSAFLNLHEHIGLVGKGILGVVGAFAEFSLVKDGVDKITEGMDNLVASIAEIAGGVAIGAAAFIAAFGVPAGLIAAAITGVIGMIGGLYEAFQTNEVERYAESLNNALTAPGGVPLEELINGVVKSVEKIGEGFEDIRDRSVELEIAEQDIDHLVEHIGWIGDEFESGAITTEEATEKMNKAIETLDSCVTEKFNAMRDVIYASLGHGGYLASAIEDTGTTIEEFRQSSALALTESEQKVHELLESLKDTPAGTEEWYRINEELDKVLGNTDEVTEAVENLDKSLENGLDWSRYISADGLNIELLVSDLGRVKSEVENTREVAQEAMDGTHEAFKKLGDPDLLKTIEAAIPGALENLNEETAGMVKELTDTVQIEAIDGLTQVMLDAEEDWNNLKWYEKLFRPDGMEGYIKERADKYKEENIDPLSESIEEAMSELGIEGAGWASDATQEMIDSLFDVNTKSAGGIKMVSTKLNADWKGILTTLGAELKGMSKDAAQNVDSGFEEGMDGSTKAEKSASNWMQRVYDAIHNSVMRFGSPSKTAKEFGVDTVEGYNQGVESNQKSSEKNIDDWMSEVGKSFENITSKIAGTNKGLFDDVTTIYKNIGDSLIAKARKANKSVTESFTKLSENTKNAFDSIGKTAQNALSNTFNKVSSVIKDIKNAFDFKIDFPEIRFPEIKLPHFNISGGYFNDVFDFQMPTIDIDWYKNGGFPTSYSLFAAGEGGLPEMLGTIGGQTAVTSSAEITGIKDAVDNSSRQEQYIMSEMVNLLQTIAAKDMTVNMDSRQLNSTLSNRQRRNGYNFRVA